MSRLSRNQHGFTIVELMIALAVMSSLLLMSTLILTQVGKLFSKGVTQSNTQNAARAAITDISSTLQLTGAQVYSCTTTPTACYAHQGSSNGVVVDSFCIDTTRYSFILNHEMSDNPIAGDNSVYHVLWKDKMRTNANCNPLSINQPSVPSDADTVAGSGSELMPLRSRLTRFNILPTNAAQTNYGLDVWVAAGEDDLMTVVGSNSGSCIPGSAGNTCAGWTNCHSGPGQEYCATSDLSTIIVRRLQ
jgi:prepilin-type N-terminal cleavage/methylation domain-containing protein